MQPPHEKTEMGCGVRIREDLWGRGRGVDGRTMKAGEQGSEGAMSGGKLAPADLIKVAREMRK